MIPQRKKIFALRISDFVDFSGESGIRTHDTSQYTRFPGARVRPTTLSLPAVDPMIIS